MLCSSLARLRPGAAFHRRNRRKFRNPLGLPLNQTLKQRSDTIDSVMKARMVGSAHTSESARRRYLEERLYSSAARSERQGVGMNRTVALQGLGDLEPLSTSAAFGVDERTYMKYDRPRDMAKYEAPPMPFTPLAARKLAEGKFWPSAPTVPAGLSSKEVERLRHEKNMSPSATKFTTYVEYYLRRDIKACPAQIGEKIDFTQLIISEVLASRRSKTLYIVWSTVHPAARYELEPFLLRLNPWVRQMILRRIRHRPNIPSTITWIYNPGTLQKELPRDMQNQLEALMVDNASTLEDRVKHLKQLDSVESRMKSIPWFMPYLWSKDKKMQQRKDMVKDLEEVERRKREDAAAPGATANARHDPKPTFVQ